MTKDNLSKIKKIKIGVLRGGNNRGYKKSLEDGSKIISYIIENFSNKLKVLDLFIDKQGVWHANGLPILPYDLIHKVDIIWDTTNPAISQVLEKSNLPIVKIAHFNSILTVGNSKALLQEYIKNNFDLKIPNHFLIPAYQKDLDGPLEEYVIKKSREIWQKFGAPWIVKSFIEDENVAVHVAKTFPELHNALLDEINHNKTILIEELIEGKKISIHSVSNFRNQNIYIFPILNVSSFEKEKLNLLVYDMYKNLGINFYLKIDLILKNKNIHLMGMEFLPDFNKNSSFSLACDSVGVKPEHLFLNLLKQASALSGNFEINIFSDII